MALLANSRAALSHVGAVAEQLQNTNRWAAFLNYVVAKIIRPLSHWPAPKQFTAIG